MGETNLVGAAGAHAVTAVRAAARRYHLIAGGAAVLVVAVPTWWMAGLQAAVGIALMAVAAVVVVPARWSRAPVAVLPARLMRGERHAARVLRPLERAGYTVLHDRLVPRGRASIDHLVIGPVGVIVIDSKNWRRRTIVRDSEDGRVWIGEHPAEHIITPLTHEAQRISYALGKALGRRVPVTLLVAMHDVGMPRRGSVTVDGVTMLRATRARHWISKLPKRLAPEEVGTVARSANRLFPPAEKRDHAGPEHA